MSNGAFKHPFNRKLYFKILVANAKLLLRMLTIGLHLKYIIFFIVVDTIVNKPVS